MSSSSFAKKTTRRTPEMMASTVPISWAPGQMKKQRWIKSWAEIQRSCDPWQFPTCSKTHWTTGFFLFTIVLTHLQKLRPKDWFHVVFIIKPWSEAIEKKYCQANIATLSPVQNNPIHNHDNFHQHQWWLNNIMQIQLTPHHSGPSFSYPAAHIQPISRA